MKTFLVQAMVSDINAASNVMACVAKLVASPCAEDAQDDFVDLMSKYPMRIEKCIAQEIIEVPGFTRNG